MEKTASSAAPQRTYNPAMAAFYSFQENVFHEATRGFTKKNKIPRIFPFRVFFV
ncbi:MAG TPA: hypothetical protein PLD20_20645 [Blastocatellia bacterium]|nr:hypothetical protein [Blastocatellia bacterium]HMZ20357.1 hypothetical protein [Blastocatellia bacterium]